jgi:hypothetical protein
VFIAGVKDCFLVITLGSFEDEEECICGLMLLRAVQCICQTAVHGMGRATWGAAILDAASPESCVAVISGGQRARRDRPPSLHACIENKSCKSVFRRGKAYHALHSMSCEMDDRGIHETHDHL